MPNTHKAHPSSCEIKTHR